MRAKFERSYQSLPEIFYQRVMPQKVVAPKLVSWNQELADFLNIKVEDENDLAQIFTGNEIPAGVSPIAQAYAGHQFGNFVPQLGDGRAILLGELRAKNDLLYDVQLKGAGRTPYSRGGDGLAALGPVLREYVVSEFMHRMGVPTTRALACCTTGELVRREEILPGAVLTRIASSHIRVGTFEFFNAQEDRSALERLLHFCVNRHYPELLGSSDLPIQFLQTVMQAQAKLIAKWMGLGFIHGVMNTDNFSIAGITIDYGPCAFMDQFNDQQVYSYIDRHGRYAYNNQARIAHWNLVRLAECLAPLCEGSELSVVGRINETLTTFPNLYHEAWCAQLGTKLGILDPGVQDSDLIESFLSYLQSAKLDFNLSFRKIGTLLSMDQSEFFPASEERERFRGLWRKRVMVIDEKKMATINPLYIPRNHLVERAINSATQGDFADFQSLQTVLSDPFTPRPHCELFATPPQASEIVRNTFCGT